MINSRQKGKRVWLKVTKYGYSDRFEISNYGELRVSPLASGHGVRRGQLLTPKIDNKGYVFYQVSHNGVRRSVKAHWLVAHCFLGDRPIGLQINHIDCNKTNNNINNLEYVTPKQNVLHAIKHGMIDPVANGKKGGSAGKKINGKLANDIRFLVSVGVTRKTLSEIYGIHEMTVGEIVRREIWR